ncbi:MAG TPA: helix-turn-helix domain-containing protein [Pseudonocardiaceae bacterium]|jgi:AcrR family transcriptional regulator
MRADARRNYERLLAVADVVVAEQGADASLEEIARRAGVGSATLHRHFPGRYAVLEAVFRDRVAALCALATEPGIDVVTWLRAVVTHAATNRGLGAALMTGERGTELGSSSHALITTAGETLLVRAQQAGAVRAGVSIADLLTVVGAIAQATEQEPDRADRLLTLLINGVR